MTHQPGERRAERERQRCEARRDGEGDDEVRGQDGQSRRRVEQQVGRVLDAIDLGREEGVEIGRPLAAKMGPRRMGDRGIGANPKRHREVEGELRRRDLPGARDQGPQQHHGEEQQQQRRQRTRQQRVEAGRRPGLGGTQRVQQGHEKREADAIGGAGQHHQQGQKRESADSGLSAAQAPGRLEVSQHSVRPAGPVSHPCRIVAGAAGSRLPATPRSRRRSAGRAGAWSGRPARRHRTSSVRA